MSELLKEKVNAQGFEEKDVAENKILAGLCYLNPILGFLQMKKSKFVKFHLNQILTLLIPVVILAVVGAILAAIFTPKASDITLDNWQDAASGIGVGATIVYSLMGILSVPLAIIGSMNMLAAINGLAKRIPIFGKITIIPDSNDVNAEDVFDMEKLKSVQTSSAGSITCEQCGSKIAKGKKFCASCGTATPEIKSEKTKCHACGADNVLGYKFCSDCGAKPIEEESTVKCGSCGYENTPGYKFCNNCGEKPN